MSEVKELKVYTGEVIWFSSKKGMGFSTFSEDGVNPSKDMFIHWSDISTQGFKTLKAGQKINFSVGVNNRGEPKAINVTVID